MPRFITAIDSFLQFFASDFQNQRLPSGKNDLTPLGRDER